MSTNQKKLKLKINPTEIEHFPSGSFEVDPYWDDLYNPENSSTQVKKQTKNEKMV